MNIPLPARLRLHCTLSCVAKRLLYDLVCFIIRKNYSIIFSFIDLQEMINWFCKEDSQAVEDILLSGRKYLLEAYVAYRKSSPFPEKPLRLIYQCRGDSSQMTHGKWFLS